MKKGILLLIIIFEGIIMNGQEKENTMKSDDELKQELSDIQYHVTQEKGTEAPFTGEYYLTKDAGIYDCVVCNSPLFTSNEKFDSGCGWPSFYLPVTDSSIVETVDQTLGMTRVEITCGHCGAHLGHVFNDGPKPTGLRYCVNSASLTFKKREVGKGKSE
jgi:peptide-methionine (R)-S-oxide reductase